MKLRYNEGAVFLVPLQDGGFARGVVARSRPRGGTVFGYFFGPRLASDEGVRMDDLIPSDAILRLRFGDPGLTDGSWPVIGFLPGWDRSKWPMPDFARRPPWMKPFLVRYCDSDPEQIEDEYQITDDRGMPADSLSGYVAVEIKLTKLLGGKLNNASEAPADAQAATNRVRTSDHYLYFPSEGVGKEAARVLRGKGFSVKDELGSDDVRWLVLVNIPAVPGEPLFEDTIPIFEQVAHQFNGEFDGWEADV